MDWSDEHYGFETGEQKSKRMHENQKGSCSESNWEHKWEIAEDLKNKKRPADRLQDSCIHWEIKMICHSFHSILKY